MTEVSLSVLAAFSSSGIVHRAFEHLLVASGGSLLAVPMVLASGDLRQVVDGCPVPWEEVWAVVDTPVSPFAEVVLPSRLPLRLAAIGRDGWVSDRISAFAAGRASTVRLVHVSGIRFAKV